MPIIRAKFDGRCYLCHKEFEAGDPIWWEAGLQAEHATCHMDDEAQQASPIKPVQKGVTVRFNPPKKGK